MKSLSLLLSLVAIALAVPTSRKPFLLNGVTDGFMSDEAVWDTINLDPAALRLVQFEGWDPVWITEADKIHAKQQGIPFMDITDTQDLGSFSTLTSHLKPAFPPTLNATEQVKSVIKKLSTDGMKANLQKFSSYRTSQQWLLSRISEITADYAPMDLQDLISVTEFTHSWGQNSIIVHIDGSAPTGTVIVGAHQDSTNLWPFLPAPGADDDGSGSVTILEAYRALIASDYRPVQDVEFHWYSAEEGGLLGSQAVARDYESRKVPVIAMSQFDMTAWVQSGTREEVGIVTDFVDAGLTNFNKKLVDAYLSIPYVETKCGYACSDHASWDKAGYASSFTIESKFENSNKHIHSTQDRIDISPEFSFEHMLEFSKLASAYVIELAGWKA
ncbi:peptidase [Vararia minispora EC-137]|uniref:Peptidase n=1 Tax=Vararia minispora EC-137 TaxID=1314806 RepID=A0ACB8QEI2_9AGAM|nr:peptidase [Vararia minispora EC-137]